MFDKNRSLFDPSTLISGIAAILLAVAAAAAQLGEGRIRINPVSTGPRGPRTVVVQKAITQVKYVPQRVSTLTVATEPGAKVVLEPLTRTRGMVRREMTARDDGTAYFDDVRPGNYRAVASKEGFVPKENDSVSVRPQQGGSLALDLDPITFKVKVTTNITEGEVRFARAVKTGVDPKTGKDLTQEVGGKCFVTIERKGDRGEAVISDLTKGYYNLNIVPDDLKFKQTDYGIDLTEKADDVSPGETLTFDVKVDTEISTEPFGGAWSKAAWEMPSTWSINNRMRVENVNGVALPQDSRYRYYTNFEMQANVRLLDGGTVGFAVRAVDPKNYYLIQISGPRAPEPNFVKGFIVRDGVPRQFYVLQIPFAATTGSKDGFLVVMKGKKDEFELWIEDNRTGVRRPVTVIPDQYNAFPKGAVGIAASGPANFEVTSFLVCPNQCQ